MAKAKKKAKKKATPPPTRKPDSVIPGVIRMSDSQSYRVDVIEGFTSIVSIGENAIAAATNSDASVQSMKSRANDIRDILERLEL